jgi:hypothetical protein
MQPTVAGTHDENHEQFLALDKRQLANVPAIMEQQIEGPHGDVIISSGAEVQRMEVEEAKGVEGSNLPVDDAAPCRNSGKRATQPTEVPRAIISALAVEPHDAAVLVQLDAPTVELCFMQPLGAARRGGAQYRSGWFYNGIMGGDGLNR